MTSSLYKQYAVPAGGPGPDPGTLETRTAETLDNDVASALSHATLADPRRPGPRPGPGTGITASVETVDEDAATFLTTVG